MRVDCRAGASPNNDAGQQRETCHYSHHVPVQFRAQREILFPIRQQQSQETNSPDGERDAQRAAQHGQQNTLGEQLTDNPKPSRPRLRRSAISRSGPPRAPEEDWRCSRRRCRGSAPPASAGYTAVSNSSPQAVEAAPAFLHTRVGTSASRRFGFAVRAHSWNGPASAAWACAALTPGRNRAMAQPNRSMRRDKSALSIPLSAAARWHAVERRSPGACRDRPRRTPGERLRQP